MNVKLAVQAYRCEPCSLRQGTDVTQLVRMIPVSVVIDGKLVGDEWFCCAYCHEPKFHAQTRKAKGSVTKAGRAKVEKRPKLTAIG